MRGEGQCHCGSIRTTFDTSKPPSELGVRECQCSFCRRHQAVNTSDPQGSFRVDGKAAGVERYRFAMRTADFLICRTCGVYFAAVIGMGDRMFSTMNVAGLGMADFMALEPGPYDYGDETQAERIARRNTRWTPTRFTDPDLSRSFFGPH